LGSELNFGRKMPAGDSRFASRIVLCAALVLALGGCAIERTDLSAIEVGTSRETVEGILGKPVRSVETAAGTTDTYGYNKGWTSPDSALDVNCGHPGCIWLVPIAVIVAGVDYAESQGERRAYVRITYGPDDTVVDRQWGGWPR